MTDKEKLVQDLTTWLSNSRRGGWTPNPTQFGYNLALKAVKKWLVNHG